MKKVILAALVFACYGTLIIAQDAGTFQVASSKARDERNALFATFGMVSIINSGDKGSSAPTPLLFSLGLGLTQHISSTVPLYIEPRLSFFLNYYLWDGSNALPAELEHRTASVASAFLDIPFVYTFVTSHVNYSAGLGPAFLFRYAMPSSGALGGQSDVDSINAWFWDSARYIYPELYLSFDFAYEDIYRFGIALYAAFPLGNVISGNAAQTNILDTALFSAVLKVIIPSRK
jgi:hypothetical protein